MTSPTADRELAFTPVYKLTEMIRKKKLSPVELMEVILRRIKELNPKLNAYLTVAEESALEGARHAEKALSTGEKLGPLHGIPTSIKDLVATRRIRTTNGSLVYKDNVPETEGTMVKRLKAAGAIIVGKTNTPEFGLAGCTDNKLGDSCRNPWNPDRTSGGSSGGAAAGAAAGISPFSQGSDGGGSVRIPAAYCGLYGLKPNYGRVPKDVAPWGVSHVSCTGPLTWTARDAALMMNVISGPDGLDYTCLRTPPPDYVKALDTKPKSLKIAYSPDLGYGPFGIKVDPEVKAAVAKAAKLFAGLGHTVEEVTPTPIDPFDTWDVLINSRNFIPYGSVLRDHPDKLMEYTKTALECGRDVSGVEVAKGWVQVEKMRGIMLDFFAKYDLLLTPCTAVPAPKVGQKARELGRHFIDWPFHPFTPVFNLTHHPAAAIPCGFTTAGLPISLQMVGRLEDEVTVLRASAAFEEARPWANKRPPIS